jgi:mannobiose 2-epimerase
MAVPPTLDALAADARRELTEHILPYWMDRTVDHAHGGFVGRIAGDDQVVPGAPKGAVLNARILWTFAASARVLEDDGYRPMADRAYGYLRDHFADERHGGVFWTLTAAGEPLDTKKQVYAQAFAIYALAEYVRLSGSDAALDWAVRLYRLLEERAVDPIHGGYFEAFARDWGPADDVRLSEKDLDAPKSMNTHLHVLEAYTNLIRIWPDAGLASRLRALIELYLEHIVDAETHHQRCFFTEDWRPVSGVVSYGHDIEASWLLDEAAEALGDASLRVRVFDEAVVMAQRVLADGVDEDGGLLNESKPDHTLDTDKHWWPQAEAVVGFLNAFQHTGDVSFLRATVRSWAFIQRTIVDAEGGGWFYRVSRDGSPYREEDKVGLWKCPYHSARACIEVLGRAVALAQAPEGIRAHLTPPA